MLLSYSLPSVALASVDRAVACGRCTLRQKIMQAFAYEITRQNAIFYAVFVDKFLQKMQGFATLAAAEPEQA